MSDQDGAPTTVAQRPATNDIRVWGAYWNQQGQSWRHEPEIDLERQKYLAELRNSKNDTAFKNVKLSRADLEWLLATHENGRGPVDWNDKSQRGREGLVLWDTDLREVNLWGMPLENIQLLGAHLEGADLSEVHLEGASLHQAHLEGANLRKAHLEEANFFSAHLEGAFLYQARLEGAKLTNTFFSDATDLSEMTLTNQEFGEVSFLDVHWGDVNIAVVDWSSVSILGDERKAAQLVDERKAGKAVMSKELPEWLYQRASRSYRQLSVVLKNQGLNDEANRFAYRAQLMQKKVYWRQKKYGQYLGSLFLNLLSGYGYRPWNAFIAYLAVISVFALTYFIIGHIIGPALSLPGSFVFSLTSFHGRGFFPGGIMLDDQLTRVAAVEAFFGLLIEVTFIATLTRRLFGG